jgi:hypothetical protein
MKEKVTSSKKKIHFPQISVCVQIWIDC